MLGAVFIGVERISKENLDKERSRGFFPIERGALRIHPPLLGRFVVKLKSAPSKIEIDANIHSTHGKVA
jgi:hypothetical protein